jgi:hypothetical protein
MPLALFRARFRPVKDVLGAVYIHH